MRWPASLQARLGLSVGLVLTVLWLLAATVTAVIVRAEMDEVFDSALRETAERILPLAVTDIVGREDQGVTQRLAPIRAHDEFFTYLVRDAEGRMSMAEQKPATGRRKSRPRLCAHLSPPGGRSPSGGLKCASRFFTGSGRRFGPDFARACSCRHSSRGC